ncbi:TIGR00159 family protein, partial [Clostridium perfringens]|nr:TIGR00159 family protein [Clostridium perfringens]
MQEISTLITNTIKNISIWSVLDIIVVAYIFYKGYILIKET